MNKTMLIVDDDESHCFLLSMLLKKHGISLIAAPNGKEAQKVLEGKDDFDGMIIDLMMPVMDGKQFLTWLRNEKGYAGPAIMISAAVSKERIEEEQLGELTPHIARKPISAAVFEDLLKNAGIL